MSRWNLTFDFSDIPKPPDESDVPLYARQIAERMRILLTKVDAKPGTFDEFTRDELEAIVDDFDCSIDDDMDFVAFDHLWDQFYDWADTARVWVITE